MKYNTTKLESSNNFINYIFVQLRKARNELNLFGKQCRENGANEINLVYDKIDGKLSSSS